MSNSFIQLPVRFTNFEPRLRAARMVAGVAFMICGLAATGCESDGAAGGNSVAATAEQSKTRVELANFKDVAVKQKTPVWCWAASAEMVHKYNGRMDITQESLAEKITQASADGSPDKIRAAGLRELMIALYPAYAEQRAVHLQNVGASNEVKFDAKSAISAWSKQSSKDNDLLVDALLANEPVVVGLRAADASMGHAVVIYAADYAMAKPNIGKAIFGELLKETTGVAQSAGKYVLTSVDYVDPMDGKRTRLDASNFNTALDFIMTRQRAQEILTDEMNMLKGS